LQTVNEEELDGEGYERMPESVGNGKVRTYK
jgi:hypothetical protein